MVKYYGMMMCLLTTSPRQLTHKTKYEEEEEEKEQEAEEVEQAHRREVLRTKSG